MTKHSLNQIVKLPDMNYVLRFILKMISNKYQVESELEKFIFDKYYLLHRLFL